jgi:hypothetical protein
MIEGLSRSIKRETIAGEITCIKPFEKCPTSMHQQFVDGTLLHGTPTVKEENLIIVWGSLGRRDQSL